MRMTIKLDENMADNAIPNRGRPTKLTDSGRKRNRKALLVKYAKTKISIGNEIDRWTAFKNDLGLENHAEVAKVLLDRYDSTCSPSKMPKQDHLMSPPLDVPLSLGHACAVTSTPAATASQSNQERHHISPDISDISSDPGCGNMSGIEEIEGLKKDVPDISTSFVNPFDLSVEFTEESEYPDHTSDPDYEPSFNITMSDQNVFKAEDQNEEDDIDDGDGDDISDQSEIDLGPGVRRIRTVEDVEDICNDKPMLVYLQQLLLLAHISFDVCVTNGCGLRPSIKTETVSSVIYLKWVCTKGHVSNTWCSQPVLNRRLHAGDLMFAAAVFFSGSNFQKIQMFTNYLKLPILSKCTYFRIQRTYLIPTIDDVWAEHQQEIIDSFRGQDLVILGDGRMDSPGHCAQYCSYTFMEYESKKILCIMTMDKRVTDRKSTNLEKACFIKGLKFLLDKGLKIVEVVTDAHVQVAAYMKREKPNIKHSFDIWHGTKNLGKKIVKVGNEKDNKELLPWSKDIVYHYWYTAGISNTKEEFLGTWVGILHYVTNVHEWTLAYSDSNSCNHGPLNEEREKGWLVKNSKAHVTLTGIVMDKRLINNIPYYINCRSTAELENFQNLIRMYASKRHSYRPPAYRGRNLLAALDHNAHIERPVLTNKDGTTWLQRMFQKKSSRWCAFPVKEQKAYAYIPNVMKLVLIKRVEDNVGMNQPFVLEVNDPRRISPHLAAVPPPSTSQIRLEQISRFSGSTSQQSENESDNQSVDDHDRPEDYEWQEI